MGTLTGRLGPTLKRFRVDEGDRCTHRNTRQGEGSCVPEVRTGWGRGSRGQRKMNIPQGDEHRSGFQAVLAK